MTISVQEATTSAMAIQSDFGPASSLAHTLTPSTAHEWSIADASSVVHWNWTGGSDAEARRSEVVDRVYRLSRRLLGSGAGNVNSIPIGTNPGVFPLEVVGFTEEIRGEGFPVPCDVVWWNAHRPPYAGSTDSGTLPLKTAAAGLAAFLVGDLYPDLYEALQDLDEAEDEAREEGFPIPSNTALGNARRLLHAMYRILPRRFEVYPMPDGEIAIDVLGGPGRSVLLLCGSDGGALCSVNMDGAHRRARYSDTRGLPDGFVRDALAELERPDSVAA